MKKQFILLLIISTVLISCGKIIDYSNEFSTATFINASPGSPAINVIIDSINQTGSAIVYRGVSLPLNVNPGSRKILLKSNSLIVPANFVSLPAENFVTKTSSTFINYDTLATPTGALRVLRLTDDFTTPAAGTIKVRYIPVAIYAPASDITFLRTTVTPADSVTITNQTYVGASPSANLLATLSKFTQIPAGNYTIKQKIAGTQTVIATATLTTTFGGVNKGIFTVYSTGGAVNLPLVISAVRQYP